MNQKFLALSFILLFSFSAPIFSAVTSITCPNFNDVKGKTNIGNGWEVHSHQNWDKVSGWSEIYIERSGTTMRFYCMSNGDDVNMPFIIKTYEPFSKCRAKTDSGYSPIPVPLRYSKTDLVVECGGDF